jgi:phospholipid/cholesterol/gamma-HCH transport system substrate-binding protein
MTIQRRVLLNLAAFLTVALGLTAYGVFTLLRDPFAPRTTVKTVLPDTAGLIKGLTATSNGVTLGTVSSVKLNPANNSVTVSVSLDPGKRLPGDVTASVIRANPLGEQSVDFAPQHGGTAPPLHNGAIVPVSATNPTPPSVGEIIDIADNLFNAIPKADLTTVVHQLAVALNGRGQDLRTFTQANLAWSQEFLNYESQFQALLANSPPILNAVGNDGPQLQQAIANTVVLSGTLAQHRYDTIHLFANGIRLGQTLGTLIASEKPNLACLLHDFGRITANTAEPNNLNAFNTALETNQEFFGPVDAITPLGTTKGLYPGDPNHPQNWLRTYLLLPPGQPQAISYNPHHTLPPTKPGAGCDTEFGQGVGPATQPGWQPSPGGSVIPPPASENRVRGNETGDPNAIPAAYATPARTAPADADGLAILGPALLALLVVTGLGLVGQRRRRQA